MLTRAQVFYQGSVQGVGFRFTARRIARRHPVTGFVRNLADGRVELVAEGDEAAVKDFLHEVEAAMSGYIRHADVRWSEPTGRFSSFDILFF